LTATVVIPLHAFLQFIFIARQSISPSAHLFVFPPSINR